MTAGVTPVTHLPVDSASLVREEDTTPAQLWRAIATTDGFQRALVDAATKWISAEPLIEPLGEIALDHIDWLVVGGESGSADVRREMEHEWARDLLRQACEQDVAFYFKQDSGPFQDSLTVLTVEQAYGDFVTYEQRETGNFHHCPRRRNRRGLRHCEAADTRRLAKNLNR